MSGSRSDQVSAKQKLISTPGSEVTCPLAEFHLNSKFRILLTVFSLSALSDTDCRCSPRALDSALPGFKAISVSVQFTQHKSNIFPLIDGLFNLVTVDKHLLGAGTVPVWRSWQAFMRGL